MRRLTPKQVKFCLKYHELGNASEAYRQAYDASNMKPGTVNAKAKELLDNGRIQERIAKIEEEDRLANGITVGRITRYLEEARLKAKELQQPSTEVQATNSIARLHGLITDKQEVKVSNEVQHWLEGYTADYKERQKRGDLDNVFPLDQQAKH